MLSVSFLLKIIPLQPARFITFIKLLDISFHQDWKEYLENNFYSLVIVSSSWRFCNMQKSGLRIRSHANNCLCSYTIKDFWGEVSQSWKDFPSCALLLLANFLFGNLCEYCTLIFWKSEKPLTNDWILTSELTSTPQPSTHTFSSVHYYAGQTPFIHSVKGKLAQKLFTIKLMLENGTNHVCRFLSTSLCKNLQGNKQTAKL